MYLYVLDDLTGYADFPEKGCPIHDKARVPTRQHNVLQYPTYHGDDGGQQHPKCNEYGKNSQKRNKDCSNNGINATLL